MFLWRFMQIFKLHRGGNDMMQWIAKMPIPRRRVEEAWMSLIDPVDQTDAGFQQFFIAAQTQAANLVQQGGGDQAQQQAAAQAVDAATELTNYNDHLAQNHRTQFPLGTNLWALVLIVLSDLSEHMRERFMTTLTMRNQSMANLTPNDLHRISMDLYCTPASALESPM